MSTIFHQLVTATLILCFLTVPTSGQQQLSVEQVRAISMNAEIAMTDFLRSVKGSESLSSIALEDVLSGYGVHAFYSDARCTTFLRATAYPLNACFFYYGSVGFTNGKITATSSTYNIQEFSDEKCTVDTGPGMATSYSTACSDGEKFFVQPSKEVTSTSQSLVYVRCTHELCL
jgi:hypothetical protein